MPAAALIRREMLVNMRGGKLYGVFGLVALALILVAVGMMVPWDDLDKIILQGQSFDAMGLHQAAALSEDLLHAITAAMLIGCGLFIPGLAGASIVEERERDTFDLLRLSMVGPLAMILGNLINTVGFFLLLFVFILPVLGATFFLIGVDRGQFVFSIAGVTVYAVNFALAGLACSALFKRSNVAIVMSYIVMIAIVAGPAAFLIIGDEFDLWRINEENALLSFTPAGMFVPEEMESHNWVSAAIYHLTIGGGFLLASFVLVRRPRRTVAEVIGNIVARSAGNGSEDRSDLAVFSFLRPRVGPLGDRLNPMLAKELNWGLFGSLPRLYRRALLAFCCVSWFAIMVAAGPRDYDEIGGFIFALLIGLMLLFPALLANSISKEHERGNIDMLRMTLLSPRDVVLGKLKAGRRTLAPWAFALGVAFVFTLILDGADDGDELLGFLYLGMITATLVLLFSSMSVYASTRTKRSRTSILMSYIFSAGALAEVALIDKFKWPKNLVTTSHVILRDTEKFIGHHEYSMLTLYVLVNCALGVALALLAVRRTVRLYAEGEG